MKGQFSGEVLDFADTFSITPSVPNLKRIEKAIVIADTGDIHSAPTPKIHLGVRLFSVQSQSEPNTFHTVEIYDRYRATCTCPDHSFHCKHILAVRIKEELEMKAAWKGFSITNACVSAVTEWTSVFTGGVK